MVGEIRRYTSLRGCCFKRRGARQIAGNVQVRRTNAQVSCVSSGLCCTACAQMAGCARRSHTRTILLHLTHGIARAIARSHFPFAPSLLAGQLRRSESSKKRQTMYSSQYRVSPCIAGVHGDIPQQGEGGSGHHTKHDCTERNHSRGQAVRPVGDEARGCSA